MIFICIFNYILSPFYFCPFVQVTVISSDDIRAHPNVTHINVGLKIYDLIKNSFSLMEWGTTFKMMLDMPRVCSDALENKEVQKLNIDDFDLFINRVYISECFLSLIDKSQVSVDGFREI